MSTTTHIEWTERTWNPVVGCTRVSAGCDHCYAVRMSHRLRRTKEYAGLTVLNDRGDRHFNGTVRCLPERLSDPLHWRKPCRVFVNSMSDLFHEKVPFEFIDKVFAVMALCPQHTFQILTKRPERMADWCAIPNDPARSGRFTWMGNLVRGKHLPLPNVWLGTSVEDQATADERIPHLLRCPAAARFLSVEPLLEAVDLTLHLQRPCDPEGHIGMGIDWVIVGGESGPGARPMHPDWVRSIRDQCQAASVPFFFKQWGAWAPTDDDNMPNAPWRHLRDDGALGILNGRHGPQVVDLKARPDECDSSRPGQHLTPNGNIVCMSLYGKKAAGAVLDGREWREYPDGNTETSKRRDAEKGSTP